MTEKKKTEIAKYKEARADGYATIIRGLLTAIKASRRLENSIMTAQLADAYKYATSQYKNNLPA